jgi:hypothetical protein
MGTKVELLGRLSEQQKSSSRVAAGLPHLLLAPTGTTTHLLKNTVQNKTTFGVFDLLKELSNGYQKQK